MRNDSCLAIYTLRSVKWIVYIFYTIILEMYKIKIWNMAVLIENMTAVYKKKIFNNVCIATRVNDYNFTS